MSVNKRVDDRILRADDVTLRKRKGKKILVLKPHRRKRLALIEKQPGRFSRSFAFAQDVLEEPLLRKHFERLAGKTWMTAFYEASYYYREKLERVRSF